jgi:hypothetical protein
MEENIEEPKKRTPGNAIRTQCVACVGGVFKDIGTCGGHGKNKDFEYCHFYPYRLGKGRPSVKTIRKFCLHCMNNSSQMVFECTTFTCPVYAYRMGKNPNRTGVGRNAAWMARINPKSGDAGRGFKS